MLFMAPKYLIFFPITGSEMHMHVIMSGIFLLLFNIVFFAVNFIGFSGLINGLFNIFGVSYNDFNGNQCLYSFFTYYFEGEILYKKKSSPIELK